MTLTANNKLVYEASIAHTLRGVWTASVQVDSGLLQPGQSVTLADGAAKWVGTVLRGSDYGGRGVFALVGGAGNLSKVLPAKWYVAVTIGEILADLARETGERISSTIVTALSRYLVGTFTRAEGPASVVLDQIVEIFGTGYHWRVLRDGTVWIGSETWPAIDGQHVVTNECPDHASIEVAPEQPFVDVGCVFKSRKVVSLQYDYGKGLRVTVRFADKQSQSIGEAFRELVKRNTKEFRFHCSYAGKVVTQHDDGTLDVVLDTKLVPSPTHVPIRYGIPGVRVQVTDSARVLVSYEDGDEHRPIATLWDAAAVKSLEITSTEDVIINSRAVKLKKDGGRSIAVQGDAVRVVAASPLQTIQIILGPGAGLGSGTYPVMGWIVNGVPTVNLPGQIVGAFSPNKS